MTYRTGLHGTPWLNPKETASALTGTRPPGEGLALSGTVPPGERLALSGTMPPGEGLTSLMVADPAVAGLASAAMAATAGSTAKGLRLPALSWDSPRAADEACAGHVVAEVIGIAADA